MRHLGLGRVDREGHARYPRKARDHRQDAPELLGGRHGGRAGPRRLASHVDEVGPLGGHLHAPLDGGPR